PAIIEANNVSKIIRTTDIHSQILHHALRKHPDAWRMIMSRNRFDKIIRRDQFLGNANDTARTGYSFHKIYDWGRYKIHKSQADEDEATVVQILWEKRGAFLKQSRHTPRFSGIGFGSLLGGAHPFRIDVDGQVIERKPISPHITHPGKRLV